MKRYLAICIALLCLACKQEKTGENTEDIGMTSEKNTTTKSKKTLNDYVTLSGKILNPHESMTLKIFKGKDYEKDITINADGTFSDTLKIDEGDYMMKHGNEYGNIYLKNGFISSFETDYEDFDMQLIYKGDAEDINNFEIQQFKVAITHFDEALFNAPSTENLNTAIENYKKGMDTLIKQHSTLDSARIAKAKTNIARTIQGNGNYLRGKIALKEALPKGSKSPEFSAYETPDGGKASLADLKGKYVYIDVWATWCGPCIREIPSLKKVEKEYHDKNIAFVSVSIDDGRGFGGDAAAAKEGWKKMIKDRQLGGLQLLADNGWQSEFIKAYKISGIPRFILIDPKGNIISPDAPRPSNPKLTEMFDALNI